MTPGGGQQVCGQGIGRASEVSLLSLQAHAACAKGRAGKRTVELLEHAVDGAGAAAAAHGNVELVVVLGHGVFCRVVVGEGVGRCLRQVGAAQDGMAGGGVRQWRMRVGSQVFLGVSLRVLQKIWISRSERIQRHRGRSLYGSRTDKRQLLIVTTTTSGT